MSLRLRLFIAFCSMAGLCLLVMFDIVTDEIKPAMRQAMEETLIDTSIMLAEVAAPDMQHGTIADGQLLQALGRYTEIRPNALVWGIRKQRTDHHIYITDAQGIVIYDSAKGRDVGKDYSQWNDVYLTLRGQYGARSTPSGKGGASVMYVAAPVLNDAGELLGVLSVGKPTASIEPYFIKARKEIVQASALLFLFAVAIAFFLAWRHGQDVISLATYADKRAGGQQVRRPRLGAPEMQRLAAAVEQMGQELEGKAYVEQYVDSLTHELKSPLSAISGAVEILESPHLDDTIRQQFLGHIKKENVRMQQIVEHLLRLATLENQGTLSNPAPIDVRTVLTDLVASMETRSVASGVCMTCLFTDALIVHGEEFLIRQALENLLVNALDFTPRGGVINICGAYKNGAVVVEITNTGSTVPHYALEKVFDRFYSLPRPDGPKSTGLGLPFARAIAILHGGSVSLENCSEGVRATFNFSSLDS
ncbi:two-component system sensor histidine kinase CreC [Oleidesulfovibrio sp.]|uniref:two-component system sensor histidine kinase CreC n=1 Tax=Oleidesulfovibrio sp. TaxID=2909707 RepID=UPI003A8AAB1C